MGGRGWDVHTSVAFSGAEGGMQDEGSLFFCFFFVALFSVAGTVGCESCETGRERQRRGRGRGMRKVISGIFLIGGDLEKQVSGINCCVEPICAPLLFLFVFLFLFYPGDLGHGWSWSRTCWYVRRVSLLGALDVSFYILSTSSPRPTPLSWDSPRGVGWGGGGGEGRGALIRESS